MTPLATYHLRLARNSNLPSYPLPLKTKTLSWFYSSRLRDRKARFITQSEYGQFSEKEIHNPPVLYNVNHDASEKFDIASENPEVLEEINTLVKEHRSNLIKGKDQLAERGSK